MRNKLSAISYLLILQIVFVSCEEYFLILSSNDPVIQGGEVQFSAKLLTSDGRQPTGSFEFVWNDDAMPMHRRSVMKEDNFDSWNVTYSAPDYPPGYYEYQVVVKKCYWGLCMEITSKRDHFNITAQLNGHMKLTQNNNSISTEYVANNIPITHEITLTEPDAKYIKNNATSIVTYWFVDCVYYGSSTNFTFNFKYNKTDSEHVVEALVVAGFEPLTTPAPPTTTTITPTTVKPNTTTTTKPNTTTIKPNTTTVAPKTTTKSVELSTIKNLILKETPPPLFHWPSLQRSKRDINATKLEKDSSNITINNSFPFVCMNKTEVAPNPKKVYGLFSRKITVKDPITNITLTGNNWLKQGDEVKFQVKCNGAPPFHYCINYYYNATRNDTCEPDIPLDICGFEIEHFYIEPMEHNLLVIVKNLVTTYKSPVTVNIYKVEKRAQLSVIVVPVSFSLVAVVLIVFGIAYYIQNRRRFTVEVANFDFGQQYSDLEYKTFRERLRDSLSNAFIKTPKSETSEPSIWPGSSKYGSMR